MDARQFLAAVAITLEIVLRDAAEHTGKAAVDIGLFLAAPHQLLHGVHLLQLAGAAVRAALHAAGVDERAGLAPGAVLALVAGDEQRQRDTIGLPHGHRLDHPEPTHRPGRERAGLELVVREQLGGAGVDDVGDVGFVGTSSLVTAGDEPSECFCGEPVAIGMQRRRDAFDEPVQGFTATDKIHQERLAFARLTPRTLMTARSLEAAKTPWMPGTLAILCAFFTPSIVSIRRLAGAVHEARERMGSLRQFNGISGFPKRSESEHDAFGTAHSSTSISAALGIAVAGIGRANVDCSSCLTTTRLASAMTLPAPLCRKR